MLRIRLRRVGKKGKPSYRIVVAQSTAPRDGSYVEWIGNYDPMADPPAISLKEDRAVKWLEQGAQPSDAVKRILDKTGILQRTPVFRTVTSSSPVEAPEAGAPTVSVVAVASRDDAAPPTEVEEPVAELEETVAEAEEPVADVEESVAEEPVAEVEEMAAASEDEAIDESSEEAPGE
jgi:small subunit ribosomal protein S16